MCLAPALPYHLDFACQVFVSSLQKRKNRRVCSPEKAGDQVERCTFSGVDGVRVNCTSTHLNKPEQSIRVGTFVPPPFLKSHKQYLWCMCGGGNNSKTWRLLLCQNVKCQIQFGFQDLVNDLDEWEEGWVWWEPNFSATDQALPPLPLQVASFFSNILMVDPHIMEAP